MSDPKIEAVQRVYEAYGRGDVEARPDLLEEPAMHMQQWWRFADAKIVFFRGSEDTEQSAAAFS
jgi:hypothetical protein